MAGHVVDSFVVIERFYKTTGDWIARAAASCGLTSLEYRVLDVLASGVASTATGCGRYLNIRPSRISTIIDTLHAGGYVLRRRDLLDRRLVVLELSKLGLETYALAQKNLVAFWEAGLGEVEVEFANIVKMLTREP